MSPSSYSDPGVTINEKVTPAAISIATVPDVLAIVATGDRSKRVTNEAVQRGGVFEEALTIAGSPPHTATLVNTGDRKITNTTIRRTLNGQTIELPDNMVNYVAANLAGTAAGPYDISAPKAIGFKMDAGQAVTIQLVYDAAPAIPVISGTYIIVEAAFSGVLGAAATRAEVAAAVNLGLAAATALGYGAAYAAVASDNTTSIKFTSPISTYASDIQILKTAGFDATTLFGFAAAPITADTIVQINAGYYDAAATWEIDYVATDTTTDALASAATGIIKLGSFPGVTSFITPTDYLLAGGDIDWSPDTASTFTGVAQTFDLSTNYNIKLALDGKAAVTIRLNGLVSPPLDYATPSVPAAATAVEVANNINAVLSTAAGYGPKYYNVATVSSLKVVLTSPTQGAASSIEFSAPTTLNATLAIFGLASSQLPYTIVGLGNVPVNSAIYYATYEYARVSTEYNVPRRFFSEDQMLSELGPVAADNMLTVYGQIAFDNGAPSIFTCQINDTTTPGSPTVNEVNAAIDALAQSSLITDVLTVDTRLNVQTHQYQHIEDQSSQTEKNFRSGWYGMPIGTAVGDKDTANTFVYRAAVTLQTAPDSPGRGRHNIAAPTGLDRIITLEDGSEITLALDSTAAACAAAARHTSFTSPSTSLASKTIVGFDVNTFPTYLKAERAQLASNGVLVITIDGGRLTILDPVTTEVGGGGLPQFSYRSTTSQKDAVSRAVIRTVASNLQGIVPDDLADFIFDIKIVVGNTLVSLIENGTIGPFKDANGVSRDIDLSRDVQAQQSISDPTKYLFRYFYYLKYPALRFEGTFSVDSPFFTV